jgi:hypothetical protein
MSRWQELPWKKETYDLELSPEEEQKVEERRWDAVSSTKQSGPRARRRCSDPQQILGSCSPASISTVLSPPTAVSRKTRPASAVTSPIMAASFPNG